MRKDNSFAIVKWAIGIIFSILAVLGTLFGIDVYIESKIERAIQSESVIKKLQSQVRPSILFDQNSAILSDQGALQFIDDLVVKLDEKGFANEITISPKNPLTTPILTCLDKNVDYFIKDVHREKLNISYRLEMIRYTEPRARSSIFSIEIVPGEIFHFTTDYSKAKKIMYFPGTIIADGLEMIKKHGNTKMNVSMYEEPSYAPNEGDTYYNLKLHYYCVFSNGTWRKLLFYDENQENQLHPK
jgi:hypothetical protein